MWIHVPETYSQSVAASGESSLDSEALSLLALSATWKTNSVSPASLQRVWRTVPSIQRLSGLTSAPSIQNRGVDSYRSWLAAFHASHIAKLERNFTAMTQESFQEKSLESPTGLDFQTSFLKTSPESSDSTGTPSDPNYERWVTGLRRDSSRRQKQAHLTGENDSSSWPTPQGDESGRSPEAWEQARQAKAASGVNLQKSLYVEATNWPTPNTRDTRRGCDQKQLATEVDKTWQNPNWPTPRVSSANGPSEEEIRSGNPKRRLETEVVNWPTPRSTEYKNPDQPISRRADTPPPHLSAMARNWPTPTTRDYKDGTSAETVPENGLLGRAAPNWANSRSSHQDPTTTQDGSGSSLDGPNSPPPTAKTATMCSPKCRRLNPNFVSWLQGLPQGWVNSSAPLATGLFQSWRLRLIDSLRSS
jgi:hypothetical protein